MNWRTTGILFVILVVLGGIVFLQSQQAEREAITSTTGAAPTTSVMIFGESRAENVVRLDIRPISGVNTSFSKEADGAWHMTVPTATTVISQTVNNTLSGLMNAGSRRSFAVEDNPLDAYGLLEPLREIVIAVSRDEQTVRYHLQVGNETPTGDAYYVLKDGDRRVHLMAKPTLDAVFALASNPPFPEALPAAPDGEATPATP